MSGNISLRKKDQQSYQNRLQLSDTINHAFKTLKLPLFRVTSECFKIKKYGKLTFQEYIEFGLYKENLNIEQKKMFISNNLHWPITEKCCDMSYKDLTEDKFTFSNFASSKSIEVPKTLGIIDKTDREFPGAIKLSSKREFKDFILANKNIEIFAKENNGIAGFGAFLVTKANKNKLLLENHGWITYEECFDNLIGDTSYILQKKIVNHKFFNNITTSLATIRIGSYRLSGEVIIPYAVLKIPLAENIVDHFWRPGNIACDVDIETGEIKSVKEKVPFSVKDSETYSNLIGKSLPNWKGVIKIVNECAKIFPMIKYQSLDIALTPKGPILIEVNTGGTFELPQVTSGKGLLTPSFYKFLEEIDFKL